MKYTFAKKGRRVKKYDDLTYWGKANRRKKLFNNMSDWSDKEVDKWWSIVKNSLAPRCYVRQ